MTKEQIITEDQLDLMYIIEKNGKASQRPISQNTGLTLEKVNCCLKSLIDIESIEMHNFNNSNNKLNFVYILTSKVAQKKIAITKKFIIKKKQEYDKLNPRIN
jgi:hypothetical protein